MPDKKLKEDRGSAHVYQQQTRAKYYINVVEEEYKKIISDPGTKSTQFLLEKLDTSLSEIEKVVTDGEDVFKLLKLLLFLKIFNYTKNEDLFQKFLNNKLIRETYKMIYEKDLKLISSLSKISKKDNIIYTQILNEIYKNLLIALSIVAITKEKELGHKIKEKEKELESKLREKEKPEEGSHYYGVQTRVNYYLQVVNTEYQRIMKDPGISSIRFLAEKTLAGISEIRKIVTDGEDVANILSLILVLKVCLATKDKIRFLNEIVNQTKIDIINQLYNFLYKNDISILQYLDNLTGKIYDLLSPVVYRYLTYLSSQIYRQYMEEKMKKFKTECENKIKSLKESVNQIRLFVCLSYVFLPFAAIWNKFLLFSAVFLLIALIISLLR